jgi:DNA-binding transcriptional LysR family regulator
MRYTLRQLEVFLAVAKYENVTRAADELAMSQSAASGALKELEAQFDTRLFDRLGKRLQLNAFGRELRPLAQHLLDQAVALEQALAGSEQRGRLHIGATLTIGNYLALDIIAEYRRRHPGAQVSLSIANTESIAARVAGFDLDMGLIEGEYHHPDLDTRHWREDELVVFAAPDHPLADRQALTDPDLVGLEWIVRERGSGTRQAFDRAMHGILPDLTIAMELQQPRAIKRAVESGLGVGCLSRISVAGGLQRRTLVELPVRHRDFRREWFLVSHREKFRSAALEEWYALCQDEFA